MIRATLRRCQSCAGRGWRIIGEGNTVDCAACNGTGGASTSRGGGMIRDEYGNAYPAPGPFWNLDQLRREHRDRGGYYFDTDTSRLFRARYAPEVYAGCMFVDSVRGPGMEREYRVKIIGSGRSVNTIRDGFATLAAARAWAAKVCDDAGLLLHEVDRDGKPHEWGSVDQ